MEHRVITASWKSRGSLEKVIRDLEPDGWSVATLGEVFSGSVLVMIRNEGIWAHEVIQLFWKMKDNVAQLVREKEKEGWIVAAIGDCLGGAVMILKRKVG